MQQSDGRKKVDGVPVFSAQNLDIAIATTDGIKWYIYLLMHGHLCFWFVTSGASLILSY